MIPYRCVPPIPPPPPSKTMGSFPLAAAMVNRMAGGDRGVVICHKTDRQRLSQKTMVGGHQAAGMYMIICSPFKLPHRHLMDGSERRLRDGIMCSDLRMISKTKRNPLWLPCGYLVTEMRFYIFQRTSIFMGFTIYLILP